VVLNHRNYRKCINRHNTQSFSKQSKFYLWFFITLIHQVYIIASLAGKINLAGCILVRNVQDDAR